ncbi:MAG TPA: polysaccharide biosynthesis C-terminal domain-containing protein [Gaiellaceae bacterium]|nr:polysaccharide biosynthesis C-terminal domain-containing protein [Gaiellaceae bacterium]
MPARNVGLSAPELQRRALRGAAWSTASVLVGLPLAVLVSVVVARTLGPREFGRYAYLTFLVPLLYETTDLGVAQATVRSASRAFAVGSVGSTRDLIAKGAGWNLLRMPLVFGLILVVAHPSPPMTAVLAGFLVLNMGGGGFAFALNAENRGAVAAKLAFIGGLAAGAASITAALAGGSGATVWAAAWASGIVTLPVSVALANPDLRAAAFRPRLPRALPAGFWRFAVLSAAVSLLYALVFSRSEIVILNAFGDHQALAVFALAYGLAQRLTLPVDTMLGPLVLALSAIDAAHPERLRPAFERALRVASVGTAFVGAAALAGVALLAPYMYGSAYSGVGVVFVALATVSLVQSAAQPYVALAYARARPGAALRAYTIALAVDVTLTVALIPRIGVWGAVVGNACGGLVAVALLARAAAGKASLRKAGVPAAKLAAVTSAACSLAYAAGAAAGHVTPLLGVAVAVAVGAVAFLAGARGAISAGDASVLSEALPRRLARGARVVALLAR